MMSVRDSAPAAYFAHFSGIVEPGAVVGAGSKVRHHAHIPASAVIGATGENPGATLACTQRGSAPGVDR
jgi:hypothetical protein